MAKKDFYDIKGLGELPDEREAEHPAPPHQPLRPFKNPRRKRSWRPLLIVLIVVIVLAGIGGGAYWLTKHHKTKPKASSATTSMPKPTATTSSGTAQYISNGSDLNLSFSYPSSWTVTPASGGNSNDQTITLTSPLTSITAASGTTVTGKVTVTVRPSTAPLDELNANNPTAAMASAQFAYTTPTTNQYQYPYATFIHFSTGSAAKGAFEEVLVTGTTQFTAGETVNVADLTGLDPIIGATFSTCSTSACTGAGAAPLSITTDTWTNAALFQQVQALFASMKLN